MASRSKKPRRPSLVLTIVLGVLTLLLGMVLGAISLVSQEVQEVSELPPAEEREPGVVYYVKGSTAPGPQWRAKRAALLAGNTGVMRVSERELNDWSRSSFRQSNRPDAAQEADEADGEVDEPTFFGLEANVSPPNFALREGRLQIACHLELPLFGDSRKFVYRVIGTFESADGGVRFVPGEGTFGRAPLVNIPIVGSLLHREIRGLFTGSEEWRALAEHWSAMGAVEVEGESLVVTLE